MGNSLKWLLGCCQSIVFFSFLLLSSDLLSFSSPQNVTYRLEEAPLDVIIPSTYKDLETLDLCIKGIMNCGKAVQRVIVISPEKLTDRAEWFDEKEFPFSPYSIALEIFKDEEKALEYLGDKKNRLGWMFQQFLKLYSSFVIPDLSPNILILDSDTIFLRPVDFIEEDGSVLMNVGTEYHLPYFEHMQRLIPWLKREYSNYSGITHHMVFQKAVLEDLFEEVETLHGCEFWRAVCRCIDLNEINGSCFSEYEIYFNFMAAKTDQLKIRLLNRGDTEDLNKLEEFKRQGYDYVSSHAYSRKI